MVSLSLLCEKDVISMVNGRNIGKVDDIEFNRETAVVKNLVIFGRPKFFGIFGRGESVRIPWDNVITIGRDAILVNVADFPEDKNKPKPKFKINFE